MTWMAVLILAAVLVPAGLLGYYVRRGNSGPARCIGCGKCDHTGVCILTGEPLNRGKTG